MCGSAIRESLLSPPYDESRVDEFADKLSCIGAAKQAGQAELAAIWSAPARQLPRRSTRMGRRTLAQFLTCVSLIGIGFPIALEAIRGDHCASVTAAERSPASKWTPLDQSRLGPG